MQFQISFKEENRSRDTCVIKVRVLRTVFIKELSLSEAEDNTSGPLNRGGIAGLSLLRTQ